MADFKRVSAALVSRTSCSMGFKEQIQAFWVEQTRFQVEQEARGSSEVADFKRVSAAMRDGAQASWSEDRRGRSESQHSSAHGE